MPRHLLISATVDGLLLAGATFQTLPPPVQDLLRSFPFVGDLLAGPPRRYDELEGLARDAAGEMGPVVLHGILDALCARGRVAVEATCSDGYLRFMPPSASVMLATLAGPPSGSHRLSRFALLRPGPRSGTCLLECPRAVGHFEIEGRALARRAAEVVATREVIIGPHFEHEDDCAHLLLGGVLAAGFEAPVGSGGQGEEEQELPYWEFHELLFHARSRMGRHNNPIGATFKLAGRFAPEPAVKPSMPAHYCVKLKVPDPTRLNADKPLRVVMEARRSVRQHGGQPLSLEEIGEFLDRCDGIRGVWSNQYGQFTRRPYPSGGGSYDLEIYLVVHRASGLERGLYHYEPLGHQLAFLGPKTPDCQEALLDAFHSSADTCYPDVLVLLGSRIKRLAWKYSGIPYATVLKHVGVLYATMYLAATAMGLAPCALGLGNADRFSRMTGTDYYDEVAVGEFMLGRPA